MNTNAPSFATALFMALTLTAGGNMPLIVAGLNTPVLAQNVQFTDVPDNHWAAAFIRELVARGIIAGFPDGTFRPEAPVTRAQFAAMVQKALPKKPIRPTARFNDVPNNYWGVTAINNAYAMGFLSGYPGGLFRPEQNIPREQVLVSLANGLNYTPSGNVNNTLNFFLDAGSISNFARTPIAAATEKRLVVNFPDTRRLNPTRNATRAEVAAFIYQALVAEGRTTAINSPYIVTLTQTPVVRNNTIPAGTLIPVVYDKAEKILVTKTESVPLDLTVAQDIRNASGAVVVPRGSIIRGGLRPFGNGTRFVAQELELVNGRRYRLEATSNVVTETETVSRGVNVGNLIANAAIGTAAAAAIAAITGDKRVTTEELLLGAGAGILATLIPQFLGLNRVDLIVVKPGKNLNVSLNSDLVL
ncbi:MAG TPA: S-layer homology domain-containing protein [Geminocystis sp. M7585_C2015_104]|nr:S-layer homology domain-containing protein [Geminocystis sp. M7585_C2015_104]